MPAFEHAVKHSTFLPEKKSGKKRVEDFLTGPQKTIRSDIAAAGDLRENAAESGSFAPVKAAETLTNAPVQAKKQGPEANVHLNVPGNDRSPYGEDAASYFVKRSSLREADPEGLSERSRIFADAARENLPAGHTQRGIVQGPDGFSVSGLSLDRIPAAMSRHGFGSEMSPEEMGAMVSNLTAGLKYIQMDPAQKAAVPQEDVAAMQGRFDTGFYALKQSYYAQLKRMRERYGTYATRMHPEDFLKKAGPQFFDDLAIAQDAIQMIDSGNGRYFDFDHNEEDRDFRTLANYFFQVNNQYELYIQNERFALDPEMAEMAKLPEYRDQIAMGMQMVGNIDPETEAAVGGAGFTEKEQQKYNRRLKQRFKSRGWTDRLFGRFK